MKTRIHVNQHIIKRNRKDVNQRAEHLDCVRYMENTYFHDWRTKHQRGFNKAARAPYKPKADIKKIADNI